MAIDLQNTLANLDTMLGPKLTPMTKAQFEAYAEDQIAKAKVEAGEDDKEEGAKKAKKRLEHLRGTMQKLAKAEGTPLSGAWTGDNGTALIPEYDHGFEDTTRKKEISLTTMQTPPAGNQGTQGDGSSAFAGAQPSYAQPPQSFTASGTQTPASGQGTQSDNTMFEGSNMTIGKTLEDIGKVLSGVSGEKAPAAAPPVQKAAPTYAWPQDLANTEYIKEGVNKRASDHWGSDNETSAK